MAYIGRTPTNAALTASDLADGIVTTAKIDADAVTDAKIADDVVGTEHLTANEVDTAALGADAVTGAQLADNAVNSEHYTDGSIDTAHIADNQVTLAKMAGGTDGNIISFDASGDPVAIATGSDGQVLTSTGAGSPPAFEALPGGGIENISTFRMTTNFTMTTGAHITANWSKQGATLGTAISESSGTFSFPQTGFYRVEANFNLYRVQGDSDYIELNIKGTTDNSSYGELLSHWSHIGDVADQHTNIYGATIFDVTNTTNDKIRLHYESQSATNIRLIGSNDRDGTYIRFIRLAAT